MPDLVEGGVYWFKILHLNDARMIRRDTKCSSTPCPYATPPPTANFVYAVPGKNRPVVVLGKGDFLGEYLIAKLTSNGPTKQRQQLTPEAFQKRFVEIEKCGFITSQKNTYIRKCRDTIQIYPDHFAGQMIKQLDSETYKYILKELVNYGLGQQI